MTILLFLVAERLIPFRRSLHDRRVVGFQQLGQDCLALGSLGARVTVEGGSEDDQDESNGSVTDERPAVLLEKVDGVSDLFDKLVGLQFMPCQTIHGVLRCSSF